LYKNIAKKASEKRTPKWTKKDTKMDQKWDPIWITFSQYWCSGAGETLVFNRIIRFLQELNLRFHWYLQWFWLFLAFQFSTVFL
jgi:hypothetical protein